MINPADTELIVVSPRDPPLIVFAGPGTSEIDWETRLFDIVLTLSVKRAQSFATPNADWIKTNVSGTIMEILKASDKVALEARQDLTFATDGGELTVTTPTGHSAVVRAEVPWAAPFEVGAEYLVFAWIPPDGHVAVSPQDAYAFTGDGRLRSLWRGRRADEINGAAASGVLEKIRAWVSRSG